MANFKAWDDFHKFERSVNSRYRYISDELQRGFIAAVKASMESRTRVLKKGFILWRARLGHDWRHEPQIDDTVPDAFGPNQMKPLKSKAYQGRVNPAGIPCLYLGTKKETVIGEVRPGVGSLVSVSQFRVERDLRIIDCSIHQQENLMNHFLSPPTDPEEILSANWAAIDTAFSKPVSVSDDTAKYAPTQILAEVFKAGGFDGVAYRSNFGEDGYNVAIFDLDAAKVINGQLHEITEVVTNFKECDNPYFIQEAKK